MLVRFQYAYPLLTPWLKEALYLRVIGNTVPINPAEMQVLEGYNLPIKRDKASLIFYYYFYEQEYGCETEMFSVGRLFSSRLTVLGITVLGADVAIAIAIAWPMLHTCSILGGLVEMYCHD